MHETLPPFTSRQKLVLGFIAAWLALNILVPLRHLLYPGNVSWTEEGHRFAWQMKLRDKEAVALFTVRDPASGREWRVNAATYLARHQSEEMASRPDMIVQFAHHLARVWAERRGIIGVEVRARVCASLNGRKAALLIDPGRDLARVERSLGHADWILPLAEPFERPEPREGRIDLRC
jgi:vitamin K-dependent gamma-carboxylase